MATSVWGVDSVSRATDTNGCSTNVAQMVKNVGSGNVVFWGRYFGDKTAGWSPMNSDSSTTNQGEATAMKNVGVRRIVSLNSPGTATINGIGGVGGSYSDGQHHGLATCNGIMKVVNGSAGKIIIPASNQVYVYLDVENCYTLSNTFWNGWADAVNSFAGPSFTYPFYACAYFKPGNCAGAGACGNHCTAVQQQGCFGVWSNQPEPGPCSFPGPGWGTQCFCDNPPPYTLLWQFVEGCQCAASIDLDYSTPGQDMPPTMLYLP